MNLVLRKLPGKWLSVHCDGILRRWWSRSTTERIEKTRSSLGRKSNRGMVDSNSPRRSIHAQISYSSSWSESKKYLPQVKSGQNRRFRYQSDSSRHDGCGQYLYRDTVRFLLHERLQSNSRFHSTRYYMSPEVMKHDGYESKSDIW